MEGLSKDVMARLTGSDGIEYFKLLVPSTKLSEVKARNVLALSIKQYILDMELNRTNDVCKCTWIYRDMEDGVPTSGVRVRSAVNMHCAVHTKEGFLRGFFVFLGLVDDTDDDSELSGAS